MDREIKFRGKRADNGEWDIYCPFTYEYETLTRACRYALVIGNIHDNHDLIEIKTNE